MNVRPFCFPLPQFPLTILKLLHVLSSLDKDKNDTFCVELVDNPVYN